MKSKIREIIKKEIINLLKESANKNQKEIKFDCDARIRIWISAEDLEYDYEILKIKRSADSIDNKIARAKERARDIAYEILNVKTENGSISITVDSLENCIEYDTIDWKSLIDSNYNDTSPDVKEISKSKMYK